MLNVGWIELLAVFSQGEPMMPGNRDLTDNLRAKGLGMFVP